MTRISRAFGLLLVAGLCFGLGIVPAVQGEAKEPKKAPKLIESKVGAAKSAATVDFATELGVGLSTLTGLGVRIEQARQAADPVGLASAARDLAVAEKVSGKEAGVTAKELTKEAIQLGKRRYDATELLALAEMVGPTGGKDLRELAKKARARAATAKKDKEEGKDRGIQGTLHVDSRVGATLFIYVDGNFKGTVAPGGDSFFYIGQTAGETTYLTARTVDGRSVSNSVSAAVFDFKWTITP
jgi:hypothetical protein